MSATDKLVEASASEIVNVTRGDFKGLAKVANDFIEQYTKIIGNYQKYKTIFEDDLVDPSKKATLLYKEMKDDTKLTQDLTRIQFQLEVGLNGFLGRKIYLTWIDTETGDFILKDEDTLLNENFIKEINAGEGRGRVSTETIQPMEKENAITEFSKDIQKQINKGVNKWKSVYVTAIQRFNEVDESLNGSGEERAAKREERKALKEKIKKKKAGKEDRKKYKKLKEKLAYFYYNKRKKWWEESNHSKKLSNYGGRGRIAEAYVDIIMAPKRGDNNATQLESQLRRLNEHIDVDRIPAIVKGDVVLGSDSSIQFAVKTGNFQMASFGQYYRFANNIKRIWGEGYLLTEKELTNYLARFARKADVELKLEEAAIKEAEKAVGKTIKETSNNKKS